MRHNQCVVRNNLTALFILVVAGYPEQPKHPVDGSQAQVKVSKPVFQPDKVRIIFVSHKNWSGYDSPKLLLVDSSQVTKLTSGPLCSTPVEFWLFAKSLQGRGLHTASSWLLWAKTFLRGKSWRRGLKVWRAGDSKASNTRPIPLLNESNFSRIFQLQRILHLANPYLEKLQNFGKSLTNWHTTHNFTLVWWIICFSDLI